MPRLSTFVTRVCPVCGQEFRVSRAELKRRNTVFCSRACYRDKPKQSLRQRFLRYIGEPEENGCILWTGTLTPAGYGVLFKVFDGKQHAYPAHRLAWTFAHGRIPENTEVCHDCPDGDNPRCVNAKHLYLGSRLDNMRDASRKDQVRSGEFHPHAKLTDIEVAEIRDAYDNHHVPQKILAERYRVCIASISMIVRRITWQHLP